ncbi:MAG: hypothetical protein ACRELF_13230, partial [Gemmataceae bacterium]
MLRAARDEIAKLDKAGCPAIASLPETRTVAHQTGALIPALIRPEMRVCASGREKNCWREKDRFATIAGVGRPDQTLAAAP